MTHYKNYTILLVDDDLNVLEMLWDIFKDNYSLLNAASGKEAIELVKRHDSIAAVVMDIKMPDMDGIATARELRLLQPDLAVIFHTGYPGDYDEDEIDRKERPFDYILKGEPVAKLIKVGSERRRIASSEKDNKLLSRHAESNYGLIGQTSLMREVFRLINKVAPTDSKIMIVGETGTGKELVARAIHNNSRRKDNRLAVFSCDRRSPDLVESELFGHVKGAFTGAVSDRIGLFDYADGGTVFLDEIGDLDISTQVKLLGVLERGEYYAVGSPVIKKTDIRLICATHKDLAIMVQSGNFREDLYYRLKGIQILLPPLRERKEDIPLLVEKFKDRLTIEQGFTPKRFDASAMCALIGHSWQGNVRELLDTIESLIVLTDSDIILGADVHSYFGNNSGGKAANEDHNRTLNRQTKIFQREYIIEIMAECNNNIAAAARLLGMDPANLRKKIIMLGIDFK